MVISGPNVVRILLIGLAIYLAIVASEVLLSIGLAAVFALGLDPVVRKLTARGWGRGKSALLVFAALFLAGSVLVIWVATPIWNEVQGLAHDLPTYVEELKTDAGFQELSENTDVMEKVEDVAQDIADKIPQAASSLLGITGDLVGSALSVVTLVFLTLFLLIGLPDLKKSALVLMPPGTAAHVDRLYGEVTHTIYSSLLGNLVISVIAGSVVFVTATLIDAPYPIVLAVIVGLFDLIPQIGSMIAAIIVVLITLAGTGVTAAAILLIVILVYQQLENYVIQPVVYGQAVELSGFATIAVVMAGGAVMGVMGAILAVPVAASVKIIVRDLTSGRRDRMTALQAQASDLQAQPAD
jgi:predicted PurR-regulated permease PerM